MKISAFRNSNPLKPARTFVAPEASNQDSFVSEPVRPNILSKPVGMLHCLLAGTALAAGAWALSLAVLSGAAPPGPIHSVALRAQAENSDLRCVDVTRYDKSNPGEIKPVNERDCLPTKVLNHLEQQGMGERDAVWRFGFKPEQAAQNEAKMESLLLGNAWEAPFNVDRR